MLNGKTVLLVVGLCGVLHASPIAGGTCETGTLQTYIDLGSEGCTAPVTGIKFFNFTFQQYVDDLAPLFPWDLIIELSETAYNDTLFRGHTDDPFSNGWEYRDGYGLTFLITYEWDGLGSIWTRQTAFRYGGSGTCSIAATIDGVPGSRPCPDENTQPVFYGPIGHYGRGTETIDVAGSTYPAGTLTAHQIETQFTLASSAPEPGTFLLAGVALLLCVIRYFRGLYT